jgi:hypothetical protein
MISLGRRVFFELQTSHNLYRVLTYLPQVSKRVLHLVITLTTRLGRYLACGTYVNSGSRDDNEHFIHLFDVTRQSNAAVRIPNEQNDMNIVLFR